MTETAPSLAKLLEDAFESFSFGLHTALVATVLSYDSTKQAVTVQPVVREAYLDEDSARVPEKLPVLADVPVAFPGCGQFTITWPISKGDTVLVVFTESSNDRWLSTGDSDVDPGDDHHHHLSDGIAIPGIRPFSNAIGSGGVDGSALVVSAPKIKLGDSTASAAAGLNTEFSSFVNIFASWTPATGDGGAALKAAITTFLSAHPGFPVGSTTVAVK